MGAACSFEAIEGEAGGSVKKRFRTVRRYAMKKKRKRDDSSDLQKSILNNDNAEIRSSFSGRSSPATPCKAGDGSKTRSFLGKAGLERAVEVVDAFGSGVTNLKSGGFMSGLTVKGIKISVLAFEVANTITRGATIMHSLSEENVRHVKEKVLCLEGVRRLVSSDVNVLLSIIAEDKREEVGVFTREVIRFGNHCKNPQWHNLDRYFAKLGDENAACNPHRQEAEQIMNELVILAEQTSELYHELNALDRFEQEYRHRCEETESLNLPCKGEGLAMLQTELRCQRKLVWSVKKKSLWSKRLEEVVEKLVDINVFIHLRVMEVFGSTDVEGAEKEPSGYPDRLGVAGLALHYANIVNQIDNIASRPTYLPSNTRDSLYRGLPTDIKAALRTSLRRSDDTKEALTVPQIKTEMEKTLEWLVPMAASTSKMYQGFGWVGEWANTSYDFNKQSATDDKPIRLQTLYHADRKKMDSYILEVLKWLHRLINAVKNRDYDGLIKKMQPLPLQSRSQNSHSVSSVIRRFPSLNNSEGKTLRLELTLEERILLEEVSKKQCLPLVSKSQEFIRIHQRSFNSRRLSQSTGSSPYRQSSRRLVLEPLDGRDLEVLDRSDL